MSRIAANAQPVLTSVAAHLYVRDLAVSCDFYIGLGFVVDFVYGDLPLYGTGVQKP